MECRIFYFLIAQVLIKPVNLKEYYFDSNNRFQFFSFPTKENGTIGRGGSGGAGTLNGNNRKIEFKIYTERWLSIRTQKKYWFEIHVDEPGDEIPAGKFGRNGVNSVGIEQPRVYKPLNPSFTVSEYKNFAREHDTNNIRRTEIRSFLIDLYKDQRIQALYNMVGLINELQTMENQYFHSRDKKSFIPYFKSLLNRTKEYAKNHAQSAEVTNVLNYLYTATFQKLATIWSRCNQVSAIDLPTWSARS